MPTKEQRANQFSAILDLTNCVNDPVVVEALGYVILNDPDATMRTVAVTVLANSNRDKAIEFLECARNDKARAVRKTAEYVFQQRSKQAIQQEKGTTQ